MSDYDIIDVFSKNPTVGRYADTREAAIQYFDKKIAQGEGDDQMWHHQEFNTLFYLALRFHFDQERLQKAAWWSVSNGIAGYWQWQVGFGFDMRELLISIGIENIPEDVDVIQYDVGVDSKIMAQLANRIRLPTRYFGEFDRPWEADEIRFREDLEDFYQTMASENHSRRSLILDSPSDFFPREPRLSAAGFVAWLEETS